MSQEIKPSIVTVFKRHLYARAKRFIEAKFQCRIYREAKVPRGTNLFLDLDKAFGLQNFKTVFDIGANTGQSAYAYLEHFAAADLYSFEPVSMTYRDLAALARERPRMHAFCCGMGKETGTAQININPTSTMSSIFQGDRDAGRTETITIRTVTEFCEEHRIDTIDFMKIDTEGYELHVLEGARALLEGQKVRVVYAECEPVARSDYFVSFAALSEFLYRFGYELFGIYDQQPHWDGKRSLYYLNPAFICRDLIVPAGRHL
jgi:FkbM family methyltransferase